MLNGTEIAAALTALEPFPIDVIGMNLRARPEADVGELNYLWKLADTVAFCQCGLAE